MRVPMMMVTGFTNSAMTKDRYSGQRLSMGAISAADSYETLDAGQNYQIV